MDTPADQDPKARTQAAPAPAPGAAHHPLRRRLNLRAAIVVGALVVVGVPAFVAIWFVQDSRSRSHFMTEVRRHLDARPSRPDLALKYLNGYLEQQPRDVEALDLRAKLLAESIRNGGEVAAAIQASEQVLRLDPDGPGRQETRRRLVGLYLAMERFAHPDDVQYRTAELMARELIDRDRKAGHPDARDHRLLGRALLGQYTRRGVKAALGPALEQLETAARLDPGDVVGTEQLAGLYRAERKDKARADALMVALLKANPTPAARLARYRHYARFGPSEAARAELERAVREDPGGLDVRVTAAEDALERNEVAVARRHLAAVPPSGRDDVRVRFLQGVLELRQNQPDEAIASWRQALRLTGGTDASLSFRLAWVLLQLGRDADAKPLMDQVRRLTGGSRPSAEYRYLVAVRDQRHNEPARALAALEEIRPEAPRDLRAAMFLTMGQCYEATRDDLRALEAYREAVAAQPRAIEPRLAVARLMGAQRGPEEAADELRRALELIPDEPALLLALAQVRMQQREWVATKQILDQIERVAPGAPELVLLRADYLVGQGKLDDAVAQMRQAVERGDRADPNLWAAYARGLARLNRADEALRVLEQAAAPDAAGDRGVLRIARARLQQDAGHERAAREELVRDLNRLPRADRPVALRAEADLLVQQGDRVGARAALAQWAALVPDDPQPALTMLDLAESDGDETAARDAIRALKEVARADGAFAAIGEAYDLLRGGRRDLSPADWSARLNQAGRLVKKALALAPQLPQAHLVNGMLLESRARAESWGLPEAKARAVRNDLLDKAVAAYQRAMDTGSPTALTPLVALLTELNRTAELAGVRKRVVSAAAFDALRARAELRLNRTDKAEELVDKLVAGDPEGLEANVLRADVLRRAGKPEEAEATLAALAKARPTDPRPWFQLLLFQAGQGRRDAAAATVEAIRKHVKADRPEFLYAQAYRVAGDPDRAATYYREALKKDPKDLAVARGAADFFETIGRLDEAEAILRRVVAADPTLGWAARKLALILSGRPHDLAAWQEAAKLVAPASSAGGGTPEDRMTWAVVLMRSPDPATRAQAIPLLHKLKDEMPRQPVGVEARNRLMRYLLDANQPTSARQEAADALGGKDDPNPTTLGFYAEALLRERNPDEAEKQIARLEALVPKGLHPEVLRARLLAARGRTDEAVAALRRTFAAREKAADATTAAESVEAALMDLGRLEDAERVARRDTELRPADGWMLARVLARRGQIAEALEVCREAVQRGSSRGAVQVAVALAAAPGAKPETRAGADTVLEAALAREPKAVDLLLMRAQVRHLQGRYDDEVRLYRAALDAKAADLGFLNNMAWTLSEALGRPAEALGRVDEVIRRLGRQPGYLDTRGVILTRLGRLDEAIKTLQEVAPALPGGTASFHLACALHKAGRDAEARKALDRARADGLRPEALEATERTELKTLDAALPPGKAPAAAGGRS